MELYIDKKVYQTKNNFNIKIKTINLFYIIKLSFNRHLINGLYKKNNELNEVFYQIELSEILNMIK